MSTSIFHGEPLPVLRHTQLEKIDITITIAVTY